MRLGSTIRSIIAAERRQQRESKKLQRDLERQAKEMAKLSAIEQARLEVETYENELDVLLSVHKEHPDHWDWAALATALPPAPPSRHPHHVLEARQRLAVSPSQHEADDIRKAQQEDERNFQEAVQAHAAEQGEWKKLSDLGRRILAGEVDAYLDAIMQLDPFAELAHIGSSVAAKMHSRHLIECSVTTKGRQAIPAQAKSLTASGKVSEKPMPRQRFIEIYQDYVCGCVLRVAREVFALLPADTLLINASAETIDTSTGHECERSFLSVIIPRDALNRLDFERLDPSDTILSLTHRGELKASRKTGDFEFIEPLAAHDVPQRRDDTAEKGDILAAAQRLRAELAAQCAAISSRLGDALSANGDA